MLSPQETPERPEGEEPKDSSPWLAPAERPEGGEADQAAALETLTPGSSNAAPPAVPPEVLAERRRPLRNITKQFASKYTEAIGAEICDQLRQHNVIDKAARAVGISRSTIRIWIRQGKRDETEGLDTEKARFYADVCDAVATWEANLNVAIREHGKTHWQALAWLLERKMPEKYSQRSRIDVNQIDADIERELARLAGRGQAALPPAPAAAAIEYAVIETYSRGDAGGDRAEPGEVLPAQAVAEAAVIPGT